MTNAFVTPTLLPRSAHAPRRRATCAPRMLDQNTILAIGSAVLGIGGGIALVAFTEQQGQRGEVRGNIQPCVECLGETRVTCNVCKGTGRDPLSDKDPTRNGPCTYCEGQKTIKCFNCAGSGIQPRYLDRYGNACYLQVVDFCFLYLTDSRSVSPQIVT